MILLKKGVFVCSLLLPLFLLTSCQNYRDLDHMVFVTSVLIDQGKNDKIDFYFETLTSIRSSSKEQNKEERIVYKVTTDNAGDAINLLETHTSAPVTLTHNKVLLFTEKFCRSGLGPVFDLFDRWQESIARTLLGIYVGRLEDFTNPNHREENITGLYLYDMLRKEFVTSFGVQIDIKEFLNQKYIGDKVNSVPIINVSQEKDTKGQYFLDGVGLVKEYKMVGRLNTEQTFYFNLLLHNDVSGNISTKNPEDETKLVSLLLQKYKFKSDVKLEDDKLKFMIRLKFITEVSAIQGKLELTKENIEQLQHSMEEKIKKNCLALFSEWKDKRIDIFDIQELYERKYPRKPRANVINEAELNLDVHVKIHGTMTTGSAK